jgi:asparagine synthase (glutamine-hydrolysing)
VCGLIGWLGPRRHGVEEAIERGVRRLVHRGPDGTGRAHLQPRDRPDMALVLGHTRLKILDLTEAANQPMTDPETGNVIVYNGEIYNFAALRAALEAEGVKFNSTGDTEVLLKAYGRWGLEALDRVAGMFAFALWDEARQRCILARDHLGIKPLYVARVHGGLLFGSEMRALLATGLVPRRLDPIGLDSFLAYGAVQGPATLVAGIESLAPGSYLAAAPGESPVPVRYWRVPFASEDAVATPRHESVARLRDLLAGAVRDHLIADVPIGAFLSGGVDSSSLVILMREAGVGPVHTFSVRFAEREYSEHEYSSLVARQFSHQHTEINLSADGCRAVLPDAMAAQDQPTIDGVNVYVISQAVRSRGIRVVLSGQGGDELFAGYATFPRVAAVAQHAWAWRLPHGLREAAGAAWRRARGQRLTGDKIAEILVSDGDPLHVYLILRALFDSGTRSRLLDGTGPGRATLWGLPRETYFDLRAAAGPLDPVNRVSLFELATYLGNMLLRDGDFMSMAHSLELRVPYLDRRVVEFVAALPGSMKLSRNPTKSLLIEAMQGALPRVIYERPKHGFTFPWDVWLRERLRDTVAATLDHHDAGESLGLRPGAVQELWRGFLAREPGVTWSRVWGLYVAVDWCRRLGVTR